MHALPLTDLDRVGRIIERLAVAADDDEARAADDFLRGLHAGIAVGLRTAAAILDREREIHVAAMETEPHTILGP